MQRFDDSKIEAENTAEAENKCQMSCPEGELRVKDLGGGQFDCECVGGKIEPSCETDADCEKLCSQTYSESECKKMILFCQDNKRCSMRAKNVNENGNLIGKEDGKRCDSDNECQSLLCYRRYERCGKPLPVGESCSRDIECRSGICGFDFGNECLPVNGLPYDEPCARDKECTSHNCVFKGRNGCARVGGNLYKEDCDDNSDCKKGVNLWCDDGECVCAENLKWDEKQEKCIEK